MTAIPDAARESVQQANPLAFVIVGILAFTVHFSVVTLLVPVGLPPLAANVVAFLVAFAVSFLGHARWTFRMKRRHGRVALRRFAVVAVAGFGLNEASYAALLTDTTLDYRVSLLLVLSAVAVLTWVAARDWAFAEP